MLAYCAVSAISLGYTGYLSKRYARDHVRYKFRRRVHGVLEEVYNNRIEAFSKSREASERLLHVEI
jgi:hypothetical protein